MSPLVWLSGVSKTYGPRAVLRNVSFSAGPGEVSGVVGPNGIGKTTLLRIVAGLVRPDEGIVRLDGLDVPGALGRIRLAYFAGESTVPPIRSSAWRALFHPVDPSLEDRPIRELSRGTRQLLGLRTLFSLPALRLIVLDEPWEGLDPDGARWLSEAIRSRRAEGAGVLVSSHRLYDLADVCDRYLFLSEGISTSARASELTDRPVTGESLMAAFDRLRGGAR